MGLNREFLVGALVFGSIITAMKIAGVDFPFALLVPIVLGFLSSLYMLAATGRCIVLTIKTGTYHFAFASLHVVVSACIAVICLAAVWILAIVL